MKNEKFFDDTYVQTAFLIRGSRLLRLKSISAISGKSMAVILRGLVDDFIKDNSHILLEHLKKDMENEKTKAS